MRQVARLAPDLRCTESGATELVRHTQKKVLIVDDEEGFLLSVSDGLQAFAGTFQVITACNGARALEVLAAGPVDLLVTDLKMPEVDGFELLQAACDRWPGLPRIVLTAYGSETTSARLAELGVTAVLEKPVGLEELTQAILDVLNRTPAEGSAAASPRWLMAVATAILLHGLLVVTAGPPTQNRQSSVSPASGRPTTTWRPRSCPDPRV